MRLTILHTNDIHGRQARIAQIATLVHREKAAAPHRVLYLDAGDVEETTNELSNITKGTAMHRLLGRASCDAATVGNSSCRVGRKTVRSERCCGSCAVILTWRRDVLDHRVRRIGLQRAQSHR